MVQTYSWPAFPLTGPEDLSVLREQARSQGYEDGYQAGHHNAVQELEEIRRATSESLAQLPEMQRCLEKEDRQQLLELIARVSSALLGVELVTNQAVIASVVDEAVERLNCERSTLTLSAAAEDEAWLQIDGLRTVVVEGQQPGTFNIRGNQSAAEFDPAGRLRTLIEAVDAPD